MSRGDIRIGILGAGAMGTAHAAAYAAMAGVEVVGVFSRSAARAQAAAGICGAQPFGDAAALIDAADAVDVCVPSAEHQAFVLPALTRGKDVFCETPLALRLEEAIAMRDAARGAGRLLQVGLLLRSVAQYAHVKAAVESGTYGRLLSLTAYRFGSYLRPGAPDHKPHYSEPSTELMTFDFDFANWLMGMPAQLAASATRLGGEAGEIAAVLQFDDGRHATVLASGLMPRAQPFTAGFRALFDGALIELHNVFGDGPPDSRFTISDDTSGPREIPIQGSNPYYEELRHFIRCIRGESDPGLLDVERAIAALTLSLATQRSIREGLAVPITAAG